MTHAIYPPAIPRPSATATANKFASDMAGPVRGNPPEAAQTCAVVRQTSPARLARQGRERNKAECARLPPAHALRTTP
jgi:hypothetical protein